MSATRKPYCLTGLAGGTLKDRAMLKVKEILIREDCTMTQEGEWIWIDELFAISHREEYWHGGGLHAYTAVEIIHVKDSEGRILNFSGLELETFLEQLPERIRLMKAQRRKPDRVAEDLVSDVELS